MNNQQQAGMTLVELMIVVSIIGILVSVSLPAYRLYMARAAASEVLAALGASKTQLEEFYAVKERFPARADNLSMQQSSSKYILLIEYNDATGNIVDLRTSLVARGSDEFKKLTSSNAPIGSIWLRASSRGVGQGIDWQCMSNLPQDIIPNRCTYSTGQ
jgi:type IV pilus assembly protein PilA